MSGTTLTTKGLVSGGTTVTPAGTQTVLPPPPSEPVRFDTAPPTGTVMIVVPTAINTVLMAAENITNNLRVRQTSSLGLPSIYKRAYLIAYETDEIAVTKE